MGKKREGMQRMLVIINEEDDLKKEQYSMCHVQNWRTT